mmetsp:Transcript_16618/g.33717  ORF Transcript_16618/g.33717 Transcript_16618/m.33717 type:complete len:117 (-) Transcript_16618:1135-1485(-)
MRSFFAILMFMGVMKFPERCAWDGSIFVSTFCQKSMSKARFGVILNCLHWQDASAETTASRKAKNIANPFWTIQSFLDHLALRYQACYSMSNAPTSTRHYRLQGLPQMQVLQPQQA